MKELCDWLKHQVKLATTPVKDHGTSVVPTPSRRIRNDLGSPQSSQRVTKRYRIETDTPSSEKKRKISWDDILHPFKARRLENEERRPLHVLRGNFSLNDIQGAKFPGKQSTATSLCGILQAKSLSPSMWTTEVVDRLLLQGDKLHSTRVVHLQKQKSGHTDLRPDELPNKIAVSEREYSLRYRKLSRDVRERKPGRKTPQKKQKHEKHDKSQYQRTVKHVKASLDPKHAGALLTTQKETLGIFREENYCYLFHPCKPTSSLFSVNDHEAVLSKFRDSEHLTTYLCRKFIKDETSYSISVVDLDIEFDFWTKVSFSAKLPTV